MEQIKVINTMKYARYIFPLTLVMFLLSGVSRADSWALPEERTVCSKNNRYCLKVIPKKLDSQLSYFSDKVDGKENAGADKKTKKNYCRGVFYSRDSNGNLSKRWEARLVNEVSPVTILVSDLGDYVVAFDNWHSVGYGDDVVAIYAGSGGALVRKFGLSDFLTENDISSLPHSVSSIWWGGEHFIDNGKGQLVLQVSKGKRKFEAGAEFVAMHVDLNTGRILEEKQDRLPSLRFIIEPIEEDGSPAVSASTLDQEKECFAGKESQGISSAKFVKRSVRREMPEYPPAARAVRAGGNVVVEMMVAPDGVVECARVVSGHPLLRAAIVNAVKKWKFEPGETRYLSSIVFRAGSALVAPDGTIIEDYR